MVSSTSESTIAMLRRVFAAYGLPEHFVSDNGPQFTSTEFQEFLQANGVKHICMAAAPYHPASNGTVEWLIQTLKQAMKAGKQDGFTQQHQLQNFLITYRSTPLATTGQFPASLFLVTLPADLTCCGPWWLNMSVENRLVRSTTMMPMVVTRSSLWAPQ